MCARSEIHFKGTDQGIRVKANRDRGNDVSNLSFKDITMENVRTAILISEYYPKVMPEGDVPNGSDWAPDATFFHNIHIENVTATGNGGPASLLASLNRRSKN